MNWRDAVEEVAKYAPEETARLAEVNETIRVTAILAAMAILTALASMIINYQGVPLP
jgi:hypothetical protein